MLSSLTVLVPSEMSFEIQIRRLYRKQSKVLNMHFRMYEGRSENNASYLFPWKLQ